MPMQSPWSFVHASAPPVADAALIAIPSSYLVMDRWLQNFAYRIQIGAGIVLLAISFVLIITLVTVIYHAARASFVNPVNTLRYE